MTPRTGAARPPVPPGPPQGGLTVPIAEHTIEFSWGGHRIVQDQTFYVVLVESAEVSLDGLDQWEQATTDKYGWLSAGDLGADDRPAHPDIPDLIRAAAASVHQGKPPVRGE